MPDGGIDRLRARVGESVTSVVGMTVEAGKVAEFAEAVGDNDPLFRDESVAAARGYDRIPAPPTYTRTSMFPQYRPNGVARLGIDLGFDIRRELHGEQAYEFERPVYVSDTLSATTTLTDVYQREGRNGGSMTFAVLETDYSTGSEDLVVTERETIIETAGTATDTRPDDGADRALDGAADNAYVRQAESAKWPLESVNDVAVGEGGPTLVIEALGPRDFVGYAGASGDFNPVHYDAEYARSLGNPSVFGQGMLTAGYAGRFLADWFGVEAIRDFRNRFTARVWPGDTLTVSGAVTDVDAPSVSVEFSVTRQDYETVLVGEAMASVQPPGR